MGLTSVSFGGRISKFFNAWVGITSNLNILELIKGVPLELNDIPNQKTAGRQYNFDSCTKNLMDTEITNLLN